MRFGKFGRVVTAHFLAVVFAQPVYSKNEIPKVDKSELSLDDKIARIRKTSNWQFLDRKFLEKIENRQRELQGSRLRILGFVVDQQQQPLANAFVVLRLVSNRSNLKQFRGVVEDVFAVTWTDWKGTFVFSDQSTPWSEPATSCNWECCVFSPGHAVGVLAYNNFLNSHRRNEIIQLEPESVIEGTVVDSKGNPISGFELTHGETVDPYRLAGIEWSLLWSELACFVRSDDKGKVRFGGLPRGKIATLCSRTRKGEVKHVATSADLVPSKIIAKGSPRSELVHPYTLSPFSVVTETDTFAPPNEQSYETKLVPQRLVHVCVIDRETRQGIAKVPVGYSEAVEVPRLFPGMKVTDAEGRISVQVPQDKKVDLFVGGRYFGYLMPYGRLSTNPNEFTPKVDRDDWVKTVPPGQDDVEIVMEIRPVPTLMVTVQRADGKACKAEIRVIRSRTQDDYQPIPTVFTDDKGIASIPIRPVEFSVKISARTEDELVGTVELELSKNFNDKESVVIVVQ